MVKFLDCLWQKRKSNASFIIFKTVCIQFYSPLLEGNPDFNCQITLSNAWKTKIMYAI